jgi:carbon monoxide dehydrogenase subunit G
MAISSSIEIAAPPADVWGAIADLNTYPQWMTVHVDFPDGVPEELKPGVSYREKVKVMGMPGEVNWTVSELEPERRIELQGEGPMGTKMRATFEVAAAGEGTQVSYDSEFSGAALAPMQAAIEKEAAKQGDESLEKLRGVVSGEATAQPGS